MQRRTKTHRRGRTRPGRLELIDQLLEVEVLAPVGGETTLLVDVGFGEHPVTTFEMHERLTESISNATTVGVDVDEQRVTRANGDSRPGVHFLHSGFDLPAVGLKDATLVRCINVLRGYGLWDVKPALLSMAAGLRVGGLLVEGSTDKEGHLATVHMWRRASERNLSYEGLACTTDGSRGFAPFMFRDVFPRDLRRHTKPGEPTFEWLCRWDSVAEKMRQGLLRATSKKERTEHDLLLFGRSVSELARHDACTDARHAAIGIVIWRPPRPSTRPEVLSPDDPIPPLS